MDIDPIDITRLHLEASIGYERAELGHDIHAALCAEVRAVVAFARFDVPEGKSHRTHARHLWGCVQYRMRLIDTYVQLKAEMVGDA